MDMRPRSNGSGTLVQLLYVHSPGMYSCALICYVSCQVRMQTLLFKAKCLQCSAAAFLHC